MLYYGTSQMLEILASNTIIYNITSFREGLNRLNLLPPLDKRLFINNAREFDILYAEWIFSNDAQFFDFFKIVFDLYSGKDVYLVMDDAEWSENILESILKLIQQRYGYNGTLITDYPSYIYAQNNISSNFDPMFGISNLDQDKDRYTSILVRSNPRLLKNEESNFI